MPQAIFRALLRTAFTLLSIGVAGYAFGYLYETSVNVSDPFRLKFGQGSIWVPMHFFGAGLALAVMPFQFLGGLRRRALGLHRCLGLLYTIGVAAGAASGFALALRPEGGLPVGMAFGLLSVIWLGFTGQAVASILRGDRAGHRRWMIRSASLTFAAVTLRIYLGLGAVALGLPFLTVYTFAAWACWVGNLAVCEWFLRNRSIQAGATVRAAR